MFDTFPLTSFLNFASHLLTLPTDIQAINNHPLLFEHQYGHTHMHKGKKKWPTNVTDSKAERSERCWVFREVTSPQYSWINRGVLTNRHSVMGVLTGRPEGEVEREDRHRRMHGRASRGGSYRFMFHSEC